MCRAYEAKGPSRMQFPFLGSPFPPNPASPPRNSSEFAKSRAPRVSSIDAIVGIDRNRKRNHLRSWCCIRSVVEDIEGGFGSELDGLYEADRSCCRGQGTAMARWDMERHSWRRWCECRAECLCRSQLIAPQVHHGMSLRLIAVEVTCSDALRTAPNIQRNTDIYM